LRVDPRAEPVPVDGVVLGHEGIAVAFDILLKSAKAHLPLSGAGVPNPARQGAEAAFSFGIEGSLGV
jgi:hypothetical protein